MAQCLALGLAADSTGSWVVTVSILPAVTGSGSGGFAAVGTGSRLGTATGSPGVAQCLTVGSTTFATSSGSGAACASPAVTQCLALGLAALGTGSGSGAGSASPAMSKGRAVGDATGGTGSGRVTGSILPAVTQSGAGGGAAGGADLGIITGGVLPAVTQSGTGSGTAGGTGLGGITGGVPPAVANSRAGGDTASAAGGRCRTSGVLPAMTQRSSGGCTAGCTSHGSRTGGCLPGVGMSNDRGGSGIGCTLHADERFSGGAFDAAGNGGESKYATTGYVRLYCKGNGDHQVTIVQQTAVELAGFRIGILNQIQKSAFINAISRIVQADLLIAGQLHFYSAGNQGILRNRGHKSIHSVAAFGDHAGDFRFVKIKGEFNGIQFLLDVLNGDYNIDPIACQSGGRSFNVQRKSSCCCTG